MPKAAKKKFALADLIDRIPSEKVDLKAMANFCDTQLKGIMAARSEFIRRREDYLPCIENFVDYDTGPPPFEGASQLHIPLVLEKIRATHAKLLAALTTGSPPFFVEPQEGMDVTRLYKIYQLMRWVLSRYANYYQGVYQVLDDATWTFVSDGWCFLHLRWDRQVRKAIVVKEKPVGRMTKEEKDVLEVKYKMEEKEEWVTKFDGPVLEYVPVEKVFMPGYGDVQTAPLIGIETKLSSHQLKYYAATNIFNQENTIKAMAQPDQPGMAWSDHLGLDRAKDDAQGVDSKHAGTMAVNLAGNSTEHTVLICYGTLDIDSDGYDEEVVMYYHPTTNLILGWTYLDRMVDTKRRPIYKADFIRRPGRAYPMGLAEILYPINEEMDAMHNQRVDYGTITNMPFFFYNSLSTLPNERISIRPGEGTPVIDTGGILFPQMRSSTSWGFQEEESLYNIANRISAISDLNVGQPNSAEMLRTQGGVAALLNETSSILDPSLKRLQAAVSLAYGDMHQMCVKRLPRKFQHTVIGDNGAPVYDTLKGTPFIAEYSNVREEVAGRVHFHIQTNTAMANKGLQRQNRMILMQQFMNSAFLTTGLTDQRTLYNLGKRLAESFEEMNIDEILNKPEGAAKPLSLQEEIDMIKQGLFPEIPLNDSHKEKAQALDIWIKSPQVQEGLRQQNIHQLAPIITLLVMNEHLAKASMVAQQTQQLQNITGSQIPQLLQNNRGPAGPQGAGAAQPAQALMAARQTSSEEPTQ